jgi:hypothetical protein
LAEQVAHEIRASAFGGLFDCALRFEKEQLDRMRLPNSPRALIGTGTHAGTAAFDKAKLQGHAIRIDDAAGVAVDAIAERIAEEGATWSADEPSRKEVESTALRLTTNYCADISPRYEFDAVELTAKPLDVDCGGILIRLKGTLDRARSIIVPTATGRKRRIVDLKTGRRAVRMDGRAETKKHRPQVGTYQLLDEHTTGEPVDDVAEILGMNTAGSFAVGTGEVHGAKELLLGTDEAPGLIELAALMFRSGLFPPNPQSFLCSAKYCAFHSRCPYADR